MGDKLNTKADGHGIATSTFIVPQVDPTTGKVYRMTNDQFMAMMSAFSALSGGTWDGSNASKMLTGNTALTLTTARTSGVLLIAQDATGGRTLSINGTSIAINTAANSRTIIGFVNSGGTIVLEVGINTVVMGGGTGPSQLASPGSFTATAASSSQITLSWTDVAHETSYELQRSSDNTNWSALNSPAANTTGYGHMGLEGSTHVYYRMRAKGDGTTYADSAWVYADAITSSAGGGGGGSYDSDAQAGFNYITGTVGATLTTGEKDAVNALIMAAKSAGAWPKIKQFCPRVGSTLTARLVNFKDLSANHAVLDGAPALHAKGISYVGGTDSIETGVDPSTLGTHNVGVTFYLQSVLHECYVGTPPGTSFDNYIEDGMNLQAYPNIGAASNPVAIGVRAAGKHTFQRKNDSTCEYYRGTLHVGDDNTPFDSWGGAGTIRLHRYNGMINAEDAVESLYIQHLAFTTGTGSEQTAISSAIDTFITALSR